jgi:excisionase family DNA binding protein
MNDQATAPRPASRETLTTDETAALLGCTAATLTAWRCTKKVNVPFFKVGRLVRYRRADVERFIQNAGR